jgi:hypothetical protein
MKRIFIFYLVFSSAAFSLVPEWDEDDLKAMDDGEFVPGYKLLALDVEVGENPSPPKFEELKELEEIEKEAKSDDDDSHMSAPFLLPHSSDIQPEDDGRKLLSDAQVSSYFSKAVEEGIFDPQRLLSSKENLEVKDALDKYAEESPVSIFFYLFDKNQKVPQEHSAEATFYRYYYSEPSAVLVYYFIEEPQRCQVHFGGKDANVIATNKVRELISEVKLGAKKRSSRISQLKEFIRQLSLQMYWIEHAMIEDVYDNYVAQQHSTATSKPSQSKIQDSILMAMNNLSKIWWIVLLGALTFISILLGGVHWVANRRFLFPKLAVKPRFYLPHGGSSGGVLSFKKHDLPPSSQRDQFKKPF